MATPNTQHLPLSKIKKNPSNPRVIKSYNCLYCGESFFCKKACRSRTPKYCSTKCYGESLKINKPCKRCGKIIDAKGASVKNRVYCSNQCSTMSRKGKPFPDSWKKALSEGRKKSDKCKGKNLYNWKGGKETEPLRRKESFYRRKKNLKLKMPTGFLKNLLKVQNNKCFYCESNLDLYKSIEHLTPVSEGGDNQPFNLVYSCKSCNSKKRTLTLEAYCIKHNRLDLISKWETVFLEALSGN